jgi:quinoprotein glucose dehydrogenase
LTALDLNTRKILWQVPLGTTEQISHLGIAIRAGTPSFGGPLATATGLVFIGATLDRYLRAFETASGREIWTGSLPASGVATPTTYLWKGRQFVVIAAGGDTEAGVAPNDTIVAFALPTADGPHRTLWSRMIERPGGRFELGVSSLVCAALALLTLWIRRRPRKAHPDDAARLDNPPNGL